MHLINNIMVNVWPGIEARYSVYEVSQQYLRPLTMQLSMTAQVFRPLKQTLVNTALISSY